MVLVGGGHSHVQVLDAWRRRPLEGADVRIVLDRPSAVYSGMVPGFVAGRYRVDDLTIDVAALARAAAVPVHHEAMRDVDPFRRRLVLAGGEELPYDVASLNIGSSVAGLGLPGVREHAVPTRPIERLVARIDARLVPGEGEEPPQRVLVVGGGAGGVELAFCVQARLRAAGSEEAVVSIVTDQPSVLARGAPRLRARVEAAAKRRGIRLRTGCPVVAVRADSLELANGQSLPCDLVLWSTGASGPAAFRETELPLTPGGFVRTDPRMLVEGFDSLFAVGDCATSVASPDTPKAGVYAVRQGPVLADNLERWLSGRRLRDFEPQRDFLTLLNLGDGTAIGSKWGRVVEGGWVMALKDWIDRRFVNRFRSEAGP